MEQAIKPLPLHDDVRATLLGNHEGPLGRALELAQASERGAWATVNSLGAQLYVTQREIVSRYYEALRRVYELSDLFDE